MTTLRRMTPLRRDYNTEGDYEESLNAHLAARAVAAEESYRRHKNLIICTPDSDDFKESYFECPITLSYIEEPEFWGGRLWEEGVYQRLADNAILARRNTFPHPKTREPISINECVIDATELVGMIRTFRNHRTSLVAERANAATSATRGIIELTSATTSAARGSTALGIRAPQGSGVIEGANGITAAAHGAATGTLAALAVNVQPATPRRPPVPTNLFDNPAGHGILHNILLLAKTEGFGETLGYGRRKQWVENNVDAWFDRGSGGILSE